MHLSISLLFLNESQRDCLKDRVVPQEKKKNHSPTVFSHYFPAYAWQPSNTIFRLHSREAFPLGSDEAERHMDNKANVATGRPRPAPSIVLYLLASCALQRPMGTGAWHH